MKEYLKTYRIKITALSPIHIGSGEKINKKEYIYLPRNHQVLIPDIEKMYGDLLKKGLGKAYMEYLLSNGSRGPALGQWLKQSQVPVAQYTAWKNMRWMQARHLLRRRHVRKRLMLLSRMRMECRIFREAV